MQNRCKIGPKKKFGLEDFYKECVAGKLTSWLFISQKQKVFEVNNIFQVSCSHVITKQFK